MGILIALLALGAIAATLRWKQPDPKHEFMLDLYAKALSETNDELEQHTAEDGSVRAA